jgi:large-conductance mechanosensitive channel
MYKNIERTIYLIDITKIIFIIINIVIFLYILYIKDKEKQNEKIEKEFENKKVLICIGIIKK